MTELLRVQDLTVFFAGSHEGAPVVSGVTFRVGAGEIVALVGESGAGKSVTALSLIGLLPDRARVASESSVRVSGVETSGGRRAELEAVRGSVAGVIFQDATGSLNPVRRVGAQLREVIERHRGFSETLAAQESIRLLEEVGLPDPAGVARSFAHQLSGGMRQRVLVALALAGDPALLIADEPTSALDSTVQLQLLRLFRTLSNTRELGVLLISHDLGAVAHVADRICVMHAGELVETGPTPRVLRKPAHPYTHGLVAADPGSGRPRTRLPVIRGRMPSPAERDGGCLFRERCDRAADRCAQRPGPIDVEGGGWSRCWYPMGASP